MRKLTHLLLSPQCRLARLALGEKRLACDAVAAEDPLVHVPVFVEMDGAEYSGLWAIMDYLEGEHPEPALMPGDSVERAEAMRLLDWAMGPFHETVTKRIVFEKSAQRFTGALVRRAPDMDEVRLGREALRSALDGLGKLAETRGYLAGREISIADFALAAHLSALDYFGEVPWTDYPAAAEWYMRIKSRPSFRPLLGDRVPGQPPVPHYAELDF